MQRFIKATFIVEILQKVNFWWKLAIKTTFCENFQQAGSSFGGNLSTTTTKRLLKFSMKTARHLKENRATKQREL